MSMQGCGYAKQAFEKCLKMLEAMQEKYDIHCTDISPDLQAAIDEIKNDIHECETGWY